jgi:hypothetical protein
MAAMLFGMVLLVLLVFIGRYNKYPGYMRLGATCSAVISAACHPYHGDEQAYLFPVQWGTLTSKEVSGLIPSKEHIEVSPDEEASEHPQPRMDSSDVIRTNIEGSSYQLKLGDTECNGGLKLADGKEASWPDILPTSQNLIQVRHCCFTTAENVQLPVAGSAWLYG